MDSGITLSYRFLIDYAIIPHDERALLLILGALGVGWVVSVVLSTWRDYVASRLVARMVGDLRRAMYDRAQRLSIGAHEQRGTADVLARFSLDIATIEGSLGTAVGSLLMPGLGLVFGTGLLFVVLDWHFALFGTLVWPLVLIGPRLFAPRAAAAADQKKESEAVLIARLHEAVEGHRTIKAYGLFGFFRKDFLADLQSTAHKGARAGFLSSLVERSTVAAIYGVQVVAVAVGAVIAFRGGITVGLLVAFLTIFWNLGWSLVVLSRTAPALVATAGAMRRLDDFFDEQPDPIEELTGNELAPLATGIELYDVTFRYDSGPVALLGITLAIPAGQYVALVGPSGSGKSTVLGLLSRFYDIKGGSITFDGVDIRSVDVASLRAQTAVVMQDSFIFEATVRENIRLGRPEATDADVEEAARGADIHDFILTLPRGYDTRIGEAGETPMSGGQRQRIAIARALVRKPSVLLLDEATSALDAATELTINETLARARKGRTTISVTHRLVSAVHADQIFVLQQCRLVEKGTHRDLLAKNGVYASLWRKQNAFVISEDGSQAVVAASHLREIGILAPLEASQREALARLFVCERAVTGQVVIRQDDPGDVFFVIVRGTVSVTTLAPDTPDAVPMEVARLSDGDIFGELALLRDARRSATITAETDCMFLTLTRDRFTALLAETPDVRARVEQAARKREASAKGTRLVATLS
jgi:ATP-binding cassette subfamily B protein